MHDRHPLAQEVPACGPRICTTIGFFSHESQGLDPMGGLVFGERSL
jgi:hypothetical protein